MRMFSLYKESSEYKPVKICTIASAVGTGDDCLANTLQAQSSLPLALSHYPSHRILLTTLTSGVTEKSVHFCFSNSLQATQLLWQKGSPFSTLLFLS